MNEGYQERQITNAESVAAQIAKYAGNDDLPGYRSYMKFLRDSDNGETKDIWILLNLSSKNSLKESYGNIDIEDIELTEEVETVINKAFSGQTACSEGYDSIYEMTIFYVATPIFDNGGNIAGIVLMNCFIEKNQTAINAKKMLVIYSVLAALVISFVVALAFARNLSKPITSMTKAALKMSHGDYGTRNNSVSKNELGVLARSLDVLAEKLEKSKAEREDAEQIRSDFFANVSHELRTPITVIRGYAETLIDGVVKNDEKKQQYYERILSECKGMERLVGDLLILSKMQNPDFVIDKEPVNIMQIFNDLTKNLKVICKNKNIELHLSNDKDYYMVLGDYDRLRQMFLIILDNAIKFSSENSSIEIRIQEIEKQVKVQIEDHGIGISKEELPYIFEKFYKSKLRQNAIGSGLGLVIAKQIATKHNGTIVAESEVGKGSLFNFLFHSIEEEEYIASEKAAG